VVAVLASVAVPQRAMLLTLTWYGRKPAAMSILPIAPVQPSQATIVYIVKLNQGVAPIARESSASLAGAPVIRSEIAVLLTHLALQVRHPVAELGYQVIQARHPAQPLALRLESHSALPVVLSFIAAWLV
jgi:hypothetical protein